MRPVASDDAAHFVVDFSKPSTRLPADASERRCRF
jgi:hypothetical protein